jgi:hypothetical protein
MMASLPLIGGHPLSLLIAPERTTFAPISVFYAQKAAPRLRTLKANKPGLINHAFRFSEQPSVRLEETPAPAKQGASSQ